MPAPAEVVFNAVQHRELDDGRSLLSHTYNFDVGPSFLRWMLAPVTTGVFSWHTSRRFLQAFLRSRARDAVPWQAARGESQ